jgi:molybdopterin-guanine dinucleotide biosynthesis protein A
MIVGIVLAGGRAMRMGGVQKALLPLGGQAIIQHVLGRLAPQTKALAISANAETERYQALGYPVLADPIPARGPLGGILAGLDWARSLGANALLSVPGDTPFIPRDLAARLAPAPACAESPTGTHWPVALWPIVCAAPLRDWLTSQSSGRVASFAALIGLRRVHFPDAGDPFRNINTPEDLAHLAPVEKAADHRESSETQHKK